MGQLSLCERWIKGAVFLSLDLTVSLFEDLWVPVDDRVRFQNELRKLLEGLLVGDSYYSLDRAALGYRVMEWFHGTTELTPDIFNSWIRNILVLEGPDRPGETRWTSLSFRIPGSFETEQGPTARLVHDMSAVASLQHDKRAQLASKLEALEEEGLVEWDARVLKMLQVEPDDILTKAALTAEYNIFLSGWERYCAELDYSALYRLWLLGRAVAPTIGMSESDIAFPGSWRFELLPLLRKFATST